MKTGIELIKREREEQILKHKRTIEMDAIQNKHNELAIAASLLAHPIRPKQEQCPKGWYPGFWYHMRMKPHSERLKIAGALCAAALDRKNYIKEQKK